MTRGTRWIWTLVAVAALLAPVAAEAQGRRSFRVSLMGGVGGSVDEDQAGLGNSSFEAGFSIETVNDTLLRVRVGSISFDEGDAIGVLSDPSVEFVTVGGEYQFDEDLYESGLFFGLGAYQLDGFVAGVADDETVVGLNLGASGDFPITEHFSILAELTFHVINSDVANLLATAHAGFGIRF